MKKLCHFTLTITLAFGWIFGCFPGSSPFPNSKNFKFTSFSWIYIYSCAIAITNFIVGIDYISANVHPTDIPFSESILAYSSVSIFYISEILFRCLAIRYCRKTVDIILQVFNSYRQKDQFKPSRDNNCFLIFLVTNIVCITGIILRAGRMAVHYVWLATDDIVILKSNIFLEEKWFLLTIYILSDLSSLFTVFFVFNITIILGVMLVQNFQEYCKDFNNAYKAGSDNQTSQNLFDEIFKLNPDKLFISKVAFRGDIIDKLNIKNFNMIYPDPTKPKGLNDFVSRFARLKSAYQHFNVVAGTYMLIILSANAISWLNFAYTLFLGQAQGIKLVYYVARVILTLMVLILPIWLGNMMHRKVHECKEQLRDVLLKENVKNGGLENEQMMRSAKLIVNSVLGWKWEFTANDWFTIDNGLIPGIAGTMMTYVLFILQLRLAESSSKQMSGNGSK